MNALFLTKAMIKITCAYVCMQAQMRTQQEALAATEGPTIFQQ